MMHHSATAPIRWRKGKTIPSPAPSPTTCCPAHSTSHPEQMGLEEKSQECQQPSQAKGCNEIPSLLCLKTSSLCVSKFLQQNAYIFLSRDGLSRCKTSLRNVEAILSSSESVYLFSLSSHLLRPTSHLFRAGLSNFEVSLTTSDTGFLSSDVGNFVIQLGNKCG